MNGKVSVIVPIYNVEKFLDKCVQSIVNQTYSNLEILLVDDGSPDNCGNMCDEYAKQDDRIKVIHKPNGGLSDARNWGIEQATGDYITCIDSDDYVHPQMIELLLEAAEHGKKDIAVCSYKYVYEGKDEVSEPVKLPKVEAIDGKEIQKIYLTNSDRRLKFTVAWGKIYKKECFKNIRYPKGKLHEDEYTTFQLLYEAKEIAFIDIPLYYYLSRENSIMGEFKPKRFDIYGGYGKRIDYYMQHGENELAKNTFFLGLHMMAQFNAWMDRSNAECKKALNQAINDWKNYKAKYKSQWKMSGVEKVEMALFYTSFNAYYKIWSLKK